MLQRQMLRLVAQHRSCKTRRVALWVIVVTSVLPSATFSAHDDTFECGPLKCRTELVAQIGAAQWSYFSLAELERIRSGRLEAAECKQTATDRNNASLACWCVPRVEAETAAGRACCEVFTFGRNRHDGRERLFAVTTSYSAGSQHEVLRTAARFVEAMAGAEDAAALGLNSLDWKSGHQFEWRDVIGHRNIAILRFAPEENDRWNARIEWRRD